MKMSIMHGSFNASEYLICCCNAFNVCVYTFDKDPLIVLDMLVHEEVSRETLRCLHNAKYQCTANHQDY